MFVRFPLYVILIHVLPPGFDTDKSSIEWLQVNLNKRHYSENQYCLTHQDLKY